MTDGGLVRVTTRNEYALLALVHLARVQPDEYVSALAIAEAQGLPVTFLVQILVSLRRGKFVKSLRGQRGGYRLARPPEEISLAEVLRHLDGPTSAASAMNGFAHDLPPGVREDRLSGVLKEIRDVVSSRLEQITLADIR